MGTEDHTIKIFVSSPGDVEEERLIAQRVLKRLADQFSQVVQIEPIFWEHEPLLATQTFQAGIPSPAETDIVVCILWARIGTRLPPSIHRPDGSPYASGTEYEFETAAEEHRRRGQPDLLVYRKTAQPDPQAREARDLRTFADQWQALDGFFTKWFHGEDGTLVAAFHPFEEPAGFEQILEVHLRKLIEKRLGGWGLPTDVTRLPRPASWTKGSPFRGLEVFEFEHAPIFFGRTKAVSEVLAALRRLAREGRAFLLIVGGSGCGKSSLVRAGVLPMLTQPGVIEGVGLCRRAIMRPGSASASSQSALAEPIAPMLTASEDNAQVWDAATGEPIGLPLPDDGTVWDVAYSPDGKTILTGSGNVLKRKGEARLWDAATGKPLGTPLQHQDAVTAAAFSPDGKSVLTGSRDDTARLWDTATGQPIGSPFEQQDSVLTVAYSPDGKTFVTGSGGQTARIWPVPLPIDGDPRRMACWMQVLTNMELDEGGAVRTLRSSEWFDRRRQLESLGGPPVP